MAHLLLDSIQSAVTTQLYRRPSADALPSQLGADVGIGPHVGSLVVPRRADRRDSDQHSRLDVLLDDLLDALCPLWRPVFM